MGEPRHCRSCNSWHDPMDFCNSDGRTEPRLILNVTTGSDSAPTPEVEAGERECPCKGTWLLFDPDLGDHVECGLCAPSQSPQGSELGDGAVEALANLLHPRFDGTGSYCPWQSQSMCPGWQQSVWTAEAILASDWLAQREVELRSSIAAEIEAQRDAEMAAGHKPGCNGAWTISAAIVRGGDS